MFFCCKGCSNICKMTAKCCSSCCNIRDCCSRCCKACSQICSQCCHCCEGCCRECDKCCNGIMDCLKNTFSTPFSFCTFVTFFVTGIPFILAIIAVSKDWNVDECAKPIQIHTLIEGICNLLNFLFCLYLCFRYGMHYFDSKHQRKNEEKNILEITKDLILYDFVVCFYIFLMIFFIVWTIIGSVWLGNINNGSLCSQNHTFLIRICTYNVIIAWIYLVAGLLIFVFTILVYSCEDGSCTCYDLCRCTFLIFSCGFCDIGKRTKKQRMPVHQNQQKPPDWISRGKNLLGVFGIVNNAYKPSPVGNPQPQSGILIVQSPNPQAINNNQHAQNYNNPYYMNQPVEPMRNPQQNYNVPQQNYNVPQQNYNVPQHNYNAPQQQQHPPPNPNYFQPQNKPAPNEQPQQYPYQNQGYNNPKQEVVNHNTENVPEKEEKRDKFGQIKEGFNNFKKKIKNYF